MKPSDSEIKDAVFDAVSATLEGMAFLELVRDTSAAEPGEEAAEWYSSIIGIRQPLQGSFFIACSQSVAQSVTDAVYGGMADEISEKSILDTLGEIVNTAAGRFMSAIVPEGETFLLGLPATGKGLHQSPAAVYVVFVTDDEQQVIAGVELA